MNYVVIVMKKRQERNVRMKTEKEIRDKIKDLGELDLSLPRTKESYILQLQSLLEWALKDGDS